MDGKHVAVKTGVAYKFKYIGGKPGYISPNNHNENFDMIPTRPLINPAKIKPRKAAKTLWRLLARPPEKIYIVTNREMQKTSSIGSKILPTKRIWYIFSLILKIFTLFTIYYEIPHVKRNWISLALCQYQSTAGFYNIGCQKFFIVFQR